MARSTFRSQNVQNTSGPDLFWKLRCLKSARPCGAKRISKSKCTKHLRSGPLLEVEMLKMCTPLWREAHFEVKMYKHTRFGPLLEVQMWLRVAGPRDCALQLHSTTLHYITLHYTNPTTLHYNYTTLHSTTLQLQLHNYTPLH